MMDPVRVQFSEECPFKKKELKNISPNSTM